MARCKWPVHRTMFVPCYICYPCILYMLQLFDGNVWSHCHLPSCCLRACNPDMQSALQHAAWGMQADDTHHRDQSRHASISIAMIFFCQCRVSLTGPASDPKMISTETSNEFIPVCACRQALVGLNALMTSPHPFSLIMKGTSSRFRSDTITHLLMVPTNDVRCLSVHAGRPWLG